MATQRKYRNGTWAYLFPAFALLVAVGIVPVLTSVNYSMQDSFSGDQFFWVGLAWYEQLLQKPEFWSALARTLAFSFLSLCLQFATGIWVARKLYYVQKRPEFFLPLFSLPLLMPWIVVGFLWRRTMDPGIGLFGSVLSSLGIQADLNTVGGAWVVILIMDIWHWTGLIIVLCFAGYLSIPKPYFQAAQIDGASSWNTFRFIELPKLRNVLIVGGLIRMADSLMIYTEPFMVTRGGPHVATTFLSQEIIQSATMEFNLGEAGATSTVYLLLVLPIAWLLYKMMENDR